MKDEFLGLMQNKLNNKGQFAIEAVLLMSVLVAGFIGLTNYAKNKNLIQNLVSKPMERVSTMAGYGTWQSECTGQGKSKKQSIGKCHPNSIHRSLSSDPK